ncbi:MAG: lipocalin-like domain-containing protein [Burkholderiales bacterium]|nr:lipocalin-like domain-containing protein [Burkholderiales bacterium]
MLTALTGTWRVISVDTEFQLSGKRQPAFGPDPNGFFVFTKEGRAMALITAKERQAGKSLEQLAALQRTMMAYSGPFRIDEDKLVIDVDISSNQTWTGGAQERFIKIAGDTMEMVTPWMPSPFHVDQTLVRGILVLERAR